MSTPAQQLQSDLARFPGLIPGEALVLRAWLRDHQSEFDRFDYNVRVGPGQDPGATFTDDMRRMAVLNSQKRIDAVGYKSTTPWIIEVKQRAQSNAIGQLVSLDALWRNDNPTGPAPVMLLVANTLAPDVPITLARYGIQLNLVGNVDFSVAAQISRAGS